MPKVNIPNVQIFVLHGSVRKTLKNVERMSFLLLLYKLHIVVKSSSR
jgi:hypothetical protein